MEITISDATATGDILKEIVIAISNERTTVREIITSRVLNEVDRHNEKLNDYFHGLVQPRESEQTLNGYAMKSRKKIDGEQQVYIALKAFNRNGFFVLVDDIQAEDLDQEILVSPSTSIQFVKLMPLVGG